jgi:citronellol/citronellal dehydrogenase
MAEEFRDQGIAFNALWPRTSIATAAVRNLLGGEEMIKRSRTPEIVADAAHAILTRPAREFTGNFCIDDVILREAGVSDFRRYRINPDEPLVADFFLPEDLPPPPDGDSVVEGFGPPEA